MGAERAAYASGVWVRRAANRNRFIFATASSARSNCSNVSIIEDHLHNATLYHVATELENTQPRCEFVFANSLSSPEDVRLEEHPCTFVLEDTSLCRRQAGKLSVETFPHKKEDIKVSREWFASDKAAPHKPTPEFSRQSG